MHDYRMTEKTMSKMVDIILSQHQNKLLLRSDDPRFGPFLIVESPESPNPTVKFRVPLTEVIRVFGFVGIDPSKIAVSRQRRITRSVR